MKYMKAIYSLQSQGESSHLTNESCITKAQLLLVSSRKALCQFIELADRALYQTLLEIIVADSLKSMPSSLLHTVRIMVKRIQVIPNSN